MWGTIVPMIDMEAVDREIRAARAELADAGNTKGILSLPTRVRIWRAMLDPDDDEVSYRHRVRLKMACVRHVLPVWYQAYPEDQRVEEMLTLAQDLIDQKEVDTDWLQDYAEEFISNAISDAELDTTEPGPGESVIHPDPVKEIASFVASGAAGTAISACYRDSDYDTAEESDDIADDDELLPDSIDESYSCASAAAGALNWMPAELTDVPARRAFWTWYLDEAIPTTLAT